MSAIAVATVVEGVLLALALVFVLALLRSHAEILRRLAALEGGGERAGAGEVPTDARAVAGIAGRTPAGDAVAIAFGGGAPPTLLAFLSTGCASCGPLWDELRERLPVPAPTRLVVVTKGSERESPARVAALGPSRCEVVMCGEAWEQLEVQVTPHFVLVGGEQGRVLGRGSANTWEQILRLLGDAQADVAHAGPASSSDRAARAEAALAAAGIGDGHPSLYPSRAEKAT